MADTGWKSPSAEGEDHNDWTNGDNAYTSDNNRAVEATDTHANDWYNFAFGIPGGATIDGIEVQCEAQSGNVITTAVVGIELSWDGGTNYTTDGKQQTWVGTSDSDYNSGGAADDWGKADWSDTHFSDANFRIRLTLDSHGAFADANLDHLEVKVYYTAVTFTPRLTIM